MLPPIFTTLKSSNAVKNIVGTNPPRIWRHGHVPESLKRPIADPYVTWSLVSGVPENTLSELPSKDRMSIQIDCWHQTDKGIETLADAVRDAMEPSAHMTAMLIDEQEPETKLFRMSMQFDWFLDR